MILLCLFETETDDRSLLYIASEYTDAPPLPLPEGVSVKRKDSKEEMEGFLDDLLT